MLLDHLNYALPKKHDALGTIGRIAFPLFAFQLIEGYSHTRDFNKYALRLAVFALISQYPFRLLMKMSGGSSSTLNIFFTLLMGLLAVRAYDVLPCKPAVFAGILIASQIGSLIHVDYGQWGILLIFALFLTRKQRAHQCIAVIVMALLKYSSYIISAGGLTLSAVGVMLSVIFILLYNGKKGAPVKYLLYAFYPVHILLLYLLNMVIA